MTVETREEIEAEIRRLERQHHQRKFAPVQQVLDTLGKEVAAGRHLLEAIRWGHTHDETMAQLLSAVAACLCHEETCDEQDLAKLPKAVERYIDLQDQVSDKLIEVGYAPWRPTNV
jgi:hypothetical protein